MVINYLNTTRFRVRVPSIPPSHTSLDCINEQPEFIVKRTPAISPSPSVSLTRDPKSIHHSANGEICAYRATDSSVFKPLSLKKLRIF